MKNIRLLVLLVIAAVCLVTAQAEVCEIHFKRVKSGGNREWLDSPSLMCLAAGATCQRTVVECDPKVTSIVPVIGGGFLLTARIQSITLERLGAQTTTNVVVSGAGCSFLPNEYTLRIESCSQYPELNGVTVSADGIVADADGRISVFIPAYK